MGGRSVAQYRARAIERDESSPQRRRQSGSPPPLEALRMNARDLCHHMQSRRADPHHSLMSAADIATCYRGPLPAFRASARQNGYGRSSRCHAPLRNSPPTSAPEAKVSLRKRRGTSEVPGRSGAAAAIATSQRRLAADKPSLLLHYTMVLLSARASHSYIWLPPTDCGFPAGDGVTGVAAAAERILVVCEAMLDAMAPGAWGPQGSLWARCIRALRVAATLERWLCIARGRRR